MVFIDCNSSVLIISGKSFRVKSSNARSKCIPTVERLSREIWYQFSKNIRPLEYPEIAALRDGAIFSLTNDVAFRAFNSRSVDRAQR